MPPLYRRKRFWAGLLGIGFLVWCLYDLDLAQVGVIIGRLRYGYLIWAMLLVVVVLWVRSTRWRVLINPMKAVSGTRMFSIYSVGQLANQLFPAGTGTAVRVVLINKAEGVTKTAAASTVMLETLLDILSLALFMVGASAALVLPQWLQQGRMWGALVVTAILIFLVAAVTLRDTVGRWVTRLEGRLSPRVHHTVHRMWNNFQEGLNALRSFKHLTVAFFASVASWLGSLAVISLLLYAFGIVLPPGAALLLMIINTVLLVIPITPGNVGTYQVATVAGLSLFGVPKTDAVSYGLVLQATWFVPVVSVGIYQYFRHSAVWRQATETLEEVEREARKAEEPTP